MKHVDKSSDVCLGSCLNCSLRAGSNGAVNEAATMLWVVTCHILVLGAVLAMGGCAPRPSGDHDIIVSHDLVISAGMVLRREHKQPFTSSQLAAILGTPEKILTAQDFFVMLAKDSPEKDSAEEANVLRQSLISEVGAGEVEKCEVWTYRWNEPVEERGVAIGGPLPIFLPGIWTYDVRTWRSYVYIIHDSQVVCMWGVERR